MSKTITRTEVSTEEIELYVCQNCGQAYQDQNIIMVNIDVRKSDDGDRHINNMEPLCRHCADKIFDYQPPQTRVGEIFQPFWAHLPDDGHYKRVGYIVVNGLTLLIIIAFIVFLASGVPS